MHQPVLVEEVAELLAVRSGGMYVDGTVGSGGHAAAILDRAGADGCLLGIDRDAEALGRARSRLSRCRGSVRLVHGNFSEMQALADSRGFGAVDGIVLDLGVSSEQLDTAARGFSFTAEGPLDMRMDRSRGPTAADLVNGMAEEELTRLLREKGEERNAWRIARAIVRERGRGRIETTGQLAALVREAAGRRTGRLHPATRTFQAIRIAVNAELESLEKGLEDGLALLRKGGRMVVIAFHSLEDRIVKQCFVRHTARRESLVQGGWREYWDPPRVEPLTRKPVVPSREEIAANPRARSARLRAVQVMDSNSGKSGLETPTR